MTSLLDEPSSKLRADLRAAPELTTKTAKTKTN